MKLNRFALYAWGVLAYNILVMVWGTFVRATGSGAGCGSHWPTCNGQVVPWTPQTETLVEFTHRVTSGLAFVAVIVLLIWAFKAYPHNHPVRWGAKLSTMFIVVEALIGAGLVLLELVGSNDSLARGAMVALHLINTFFLLASLTLTAWWASGGQPLRLKRQGWLGWALGFGFLSLLILGASGAVTALGDTLFPATSLAEGLQQKFSPTAHLFVRLRLWHPTIAIVVGIYLIVIAAVFNAIRPTNHTRQIAKIITVVYLTQIAVGAFNVVLLAPVWMQLLHLFVSDLILITWVLFMASAFGQNRQGITLPAASPPSMITTKG